MGNGGGKVVSLSITLLSRSLRCPAQLSLTGGHMPLSPSFPPSPCASSSASRLPAPLQRPCFWRGGRGGASQTQGQRERNFWRECSGSTRVRPRHCRYQRNCDLPVQRGLRYFNLGTSSSFCLLLTMSIQFRPPPCPLPNPPHPIPDSHHPSKSIFIVMSPVDWSNFLDT